MCLDIDNIPSPGLETLISPRLALFGIYLTVQRRRSNESDGFSRRVFSRYESFLSFSIDARFLAYCCIIYLASSYLATGVQAVIEGDAFHTQSPVARNVLCAAEKLDGWLKHPETAYQLRNFHLGSFLL